MTSLSESHVEDVTLGYALPHGPGICADGPNPGRISYDHVLLTVRLREALGRLNPHRPADALNEVLRKLKQTETPRRWRRPTVAAGATTASA